MAILDGLSDIPSKVGQLGKDLSPLTGVAGFLYGVDSKWMSSNQGTSYPFSMQGFYDMIGGVLGSGAVKALGGTWGGSSRIFNLGAVVNKGTGLAILLYAAKEYVPNKWTRIAYNIGFAPALGYAIGRIFDDPLYTTGTRQAYTNPGNSGTWIPTTNKGGW